MQLTLRPFHALAFVCIVAVLLGCSAGTARGPMPAGSHAASGQAASMMFIQQWGQILWGLITSQTGTETPTFGPPVFNPDGSVSVTFTTADGTEVTMTTFMDGSGRLDIIYPDGSTQTVLQSAVQWDFVSKWTTNWQITSSEGLSVTYTSVVDDQGTMFDITDDTTELEGSSVLPGNLTQQFTAFTGAGQTTVQAEQSDGSTFTLVVPLASPMFMYPDFSQPTTGTYSGGDFNIQFTLTSTPAAPSRWASMSSDLGGGLTGEFSLNPDFSGSGQLLQDGELVALVSWTSTGETEISFLTAESGAASPAGAALDYLLNRWQTLTALMAPAP